MRKRFKLVAIVLAAAIALTVGLTATTFAWGPSEGGGDKSPAETFVGKVADILELDQEQVADAFRQARGEMRDEAIEKRLDKAVENGLITEEEAGEILEWWQSRPEAMEQFGLRERLQHRNAWRQQQQCCNRPGRLGLAMMLDERVEGTVAAVSEEESAITVITDDGDEIIFEYTSNTVFSLRGVVVVEEGQTVVAWCWEDVAGNLTAKVVRVGLPLEEDVE
jgi:hypothetical protein